MPIHFDGQGFTTEQGQPLTLQQAAEWSDHARAHGIKNDIPQANLDSEVPRAVDLLQRAYAILGTTGKVTSFFRGPILNADVGGKIAPPSAHLSGRAVDSIPDGVTVEEAFGILRANAHALGFDQLIIEHDHAGNEWLHLAVARDGVSPRLMAFALEKGAITDRKVTG